MRKHMIRARRELDFCDFCGVELAGGEYHVLKDGMKNGAGHCFADSAPYRRTS